MGGGEGGGGSHTTHFQVGLKSKIIEKNYRL